MSDSDDDLLSNSVFTLPNDGSTILSAKGPGINFTLPRTLAPPRSNYAESNFGRQRNKREMSPMSVASACAARFRAPWNAGSNYERQRNKREMSPMSVASACDARFRSFNNSYQPGAMSSQRSGYNWRSGSPMSTRTCDTNSTITSRDVAHVLNNPNFNNERDFRIIDKAISNYNKFRRIVRRQKQKMFLQRSKIHNYDSGEQTSLSSSSDDNCSTKTTGYRKNMPSNRSTRIDISEFRRTFQESDIYKDCTDNFRQNSSRSCINRPSANSTLMSINSARSINKNIYEPRNKGVFVFGNQSNFMTQKERFQNGFLLPSQRFNKSIATSTIHETQRNHIEDTDSDDNIFSFSVNNKDKALPKRKRSIDEDNADLASNKRARVVSPCANSTEARRAKEMDNTNTVTKLNDFVFAKPSLPIKKTVKEKLIQSAPPKPNIVVSEFTETQINKETTKDNEEIPNNESLSTDVSMRPSFIKRKLFTQKLDVAENRNVSSENLAANSPQGSIYKSIQNEKHKARKLVTNQSCLNREIQEDSNLLDLIHKIVPPNSLNITTQSNRTEIQNNKNTNNNDKWDVSSIISMNNNEDECSDTFTDEDILNGDNNNTVMLVPSENSDKKKNLHTSENVTNEEKHPESDEVARKDKHPYTDNVTRTKGKLPVSGAKNYLSRFWETDSESDVECLLVSKNVPSKDKDHIYEKVTNEEKHLESNEVARKDKQPYTDKVITKGKVPVSGAKNYFSRFWETDTESDVECLLVSKNVPSKDKDHISVKVTNEEKHLESNEVARKDIHPYTDKVTTKGTLPISSAKNFVRRFWEATDTESDVECLTAKRNNFRENDFTRPQERVAPQLPGGAAIFNKPASIVDASINSMAETTQRFNAPGFKIKSHRSLKPKKCSDENKENTIKSYFDPLNKTQKSNEQIQSDNKKIDDKIETQKNNNINKTKKQREIIVKVTPIKILKTPPKAKQNKKTVDIEIKINKTKKQIKVTPTKILKTPPKAKHRKKNVEAENTVQPRGQTELANKKQDPTKAQSKKQETAKSQGKKQGTVKEQPKKQVTTKAQANKLETVKQQSKKQDINKTKDKEIQNKNKDTVTAKKSESKTTKETKTPPKTKPKENETQKIREQTKNTRNKKILLDYSSITNSSLENDISKMGRPIRSCRLSSLTNSSNGSFNSTMTLRPRKTSSKVKCINLTCCKRSDRAI